MRRRNGLRLPRSPQAVRDAGARLDPRAEQLIAGLIDQALREYATGTFTMSGSEAVDLMLDLRNEMRDIAELPWAEIGDLRVPAHRLPSRSGRAYAGATSG
jgi:hypothetical protein